MTEPDGADRAREAISRLVGLEMFDYWNLLSTRYFYFRRSGAATSRNGADYNLMVECPWRIERRGRVLVGSDDYGVLYEGEDGPRSSPSEDVRTQDAKLAEVFGKAQENGLVVVAVEVDATGGVRLELTGGRALSVFPASEDYVDWILSANGAGSIGLFRGRIEGELK